MVPRFSQNVWRVSLINLQRRAFASVVAVVVAVVVVVVLLMLFWVFVSHCAWPVNLPLTFPLHIRSPQEAVKATFSALHSSPDGKKLKPVNASLLAQRRGKKGSKY